MLTLMRFEIHLMKVNETLKTNFIKYLARSSYQLEREIF